MSLESKVVLIVDDSQPIRAHLKTICQSLGFRTIHEAGDGQEALTILAEKPVDLVLSDWNMPYLKGDQLVAIMKENKKMQSTPVILISSEADKAAILQLLLAGVAGYIVKPFVDATVKEKILSALKMPTKK